MAAALAGPGRGRVPSADTVGRATRTDARARFQQQTGCPTTADNCDIVAGSTSWSLAVKPQTMPALLNELRSVVTRTT